MRLIGRETSGSHPLGVLHEESDCDHCSSYALVGGTVKLGAAQGYESALPLRIADSKCDRVLISRLQVHAPRTVRLARRDGAAR